MNRCLTFSLLLVCITCVLAQYRPNPKPKPKVPEVDQKCMECICQASSNCDESLKCHNANGAYFCGPYVITWPYWHDAGRPGDKGRAHDFETCLNNKTCAEEAVRGYMRKYGQDCDGSGTIDCIDFARIHKLGFSSCGGDAIYNTDYYEKFDICYNGYPSAVNYNNDGYNPGGFQAFPAFPGADEGDLPDYGDEHIQARNGRQA